MDRNVCPWKDENDQKNADAISPRVSIVGHGYVQRGKSIVYAFDWTDEGKNHPLGTRIIAQIS